MAVDKLVDSTQLDADLTSVANAIRTKGGTSAQLAFPAEFVSAIQAIPSGGGTDPITQMYNNTLTEYETPVTYIAHGIFRSYGPLQSFKAPNCTVIEGGFALSGTGITSLALPAIQRIRQYGNFSGCRSLLTVDLGPDLTVFTDAAFLDCINLASVILRRSAAPTPLGNVNVFNNTPFKSGGTGGTIYIPKVLYDHLGDGTGLDYKAATNWSALNGYGTITWAQIEGSQYENYYADGTPIT